MMGTVIYGCGSTFVRLDEVLASGMETLSRSILVLAGQQHWCYRDTVSMTTAGISDSNKVQMIQSPNETLTRGIFFLLGQM